MTDGPIDLRELIALAADTSTESRKALVAVIADLFADRSEAITDRERALMTEILARLIGQFERDVRQDLAARFADNPAVPSDLVVMLANDEICVAEPILRRSRVLEDEELVAIIHHRTIEHQIAIARRRHVSERVSAALAETANEDVIRILLENEDATISAATMAFLVEESRRVDSYQEPLLHRHDLPVDLARRMYLWVSAALREHLIRQFQIDPEALDESLEIAAAELTEQVSAEQRSHREVGERLAERLSDAMLVTPDLLIRTLRQGEVGLFETLLGRLARLRPERVQSIMTEPSGRSLTIVCRALNFGKDKFSSIYLLSRQSGESRVRDPRALSRMLKFYDSIDPADALKVVTLWRRSPDYLNAIERVGG